jgi:hypothetical protein
MNLIFKKSADIYMETIDEKDKSLNEEVREIMSKVEKWEYLWCLVRDTVGGKEMVYMKEFFHPFCESCRDAFVAAMLAFHGCYKQSLQVLRNCLELVVFSDYLSKNRWQYQKWIKGQDLGVGFSRIAQQVYDHYPQLASWVIQLHNELSSATHSGKIKETDRIFSSIEKIGLCSEHGNEPCPMIKTMTLSVERNDLQRFSTCLRKVYHFVVFRVLNRFEILNRIEEPEDELCFLVDRKYLEIREDGVYFNKIFEENNTIGRTSRNDKNGQ